MYKKKNIRMPFMFIHNPMNSRLRDPVTCNDFVDWCEFIDRYIFLSQQLVRIIGNSYWKIGQFSWYIHFIFKGKNVFHLFQLMSIPQWKVYICETTISSKQKARCEQFKIENKNHFSFSFIYVMFFVYDV